jgi:ketosteroid isomerase-like protein
MRITNLTLLFIAITVALTAACTPTQNTNTGTAGQNMATPEPTPDKAAIVAEITRIENDWPRIIKERDAAAVRKIEADDAVIVYPDGSVGGKEQDIKDMEAGNLSYESWDISELNIKVLDGDSAVATMRLDVKNGKYKLPNGKENNISGTYRAIDTFARRNGQWQIVASATTPVQSPAATASPTPAAASTPATKPSPPKPSATRRTPSPPPANQ